MLQIYTSVYLNINAHTYNGNILYVTIKNYFLINKNWNVLEI